MPLRERIFHDPHNSFRCFIHDYPCEFARWNYHPEHEIHLIRRSSGHAFVGDHIGVFAPGNLSFVNSNIPHNWVSKDIGTGMVAGRDLVIQFDPDLFGHAGDVFPEIRQHRQIEEAFEQSWEYYGETARRGAVLMEAVYATNGLLKLVRFLELIDLLSSTQQRKPLASKGYQPRLDSREAALIDRAVTIVLDTLPDEVHMIDVAAQLGMSATAFSRFFKQCTGNTFVDYLRKFRIAEACKLLSDTEMPVTDICFSVGYSNISNFNRSFLRERGLTPTRYRKLTREAAISHLG